MATNATHSHAAQYAELRHIQAILGHTSLRSTQIYTHADIEDLSAVEQIRVVSLMSSDFLRARSAHKQIQAAAPFEEMRRIDLVTCCRAYNEFLNQLAKERHAKERLVFIRTTGSLTYPI